MECTHNVERSRHIVWKTAAGVHHDVAGDSSSDMKEVTITGLGGTSRSVVVSSGEPLKGQVEEQLGMTRGYDARLMHGAVLLKDDALLPDGVVDLTLFAQCRPLEWWIDEVEGFNPGCCVHFQEMPTDIRSHPDAAMAAARKDPSHFRTLEEELRADKKIALAVVRRDIRMLKYVDRSLRADHGFVGEALLWADRQLPWPRYHTEWECNAIDRECLEVLEQIDENLFQDLDVACAAVSFHSGVLTKLPPHFQNHREVVIAASQSRRGSPQIPSELLVDRDVAIEMVNRDGNALRDLPTNLREDIGVVCAALSETLDAFWYLSPALREDPFVQASISIAERRQRSQMLYSRWGGAADDSDEEPEEPKHEEGATQIWGCAANQLAAELAAPMGGIAKRSRQQRGIKASSVEERDPEQATALACSRKRHIRSRHLSKRWKQCTRMNARDYKEQEHLSNLGA